MPEILRSTAVNAQSAIQADISGRVSVQVTGLADQQGSQLGPTVRIVARADAAQPWATVATIRPGDAAVRDISLAGEWRAELLNNVAAAEIVVAVADADGIADQTISGPAALSALNTDLLTGVVNGWLDVRHMRSAAIQIIASAGISGGAVAFEQTNDPINASAGRPLPVAEMDTVSSGFLTTAQAIAASTIRMFAARIDAGYIRARISTAFTGGTVRAVAILSEAPAAGNLMAVTQLTAASLVARVEGTAASNSASVPQPLLGSVLATTSQPTAATGGRQVSTQGDVAGRSVVKVGGIAATHLTGRAVISTTTETTLVAAIASQRHELYLVTVANPNASAVWVDLRDSVGGTIRQSLFVPANDTLAIPIPAGLPAAAVNTAWTAQLRAAPATAVEVCVSSYPTTA